MKPLKKLRLITIHCKCGAKLVRYCKGPGRALLKIHRDRVDQDYFGIFSDDSLPEGSDILCPACNERIATVRKVNGKYVHKVNQGRLGVIRKS